MHNQKYLTKLFSATSYTAFFLSLNFLHQDLHAIFRLSQPGNF